MLEGLKRCSLGGGGGAELERVLLSLLLPQTLARHVRAPCRCADAEGAGVAGRLTGHRTRLGSEDTPRYTRTIGGHAGRDLRARCWDGCVRGRKAEGGRGAAAGAQRPGGVGAAASGQDSDDDSDRLARRPGVLLACGRGRRRP